MLLVLPLRRCTAAEDDVDYTIYRKEREKMNKEEKRQIVSNVTSPTDWIGE